MSENNSVFVILWQSNANDAREFTALVGVREQHSKQAAQSLQPLSDTQQASKFIILLKQIQIGINGFKPPFRPSR